MCRQISLEGDFQTPFPSCRTFTYNITYCVWGRLVARTQSAGKSESAMDGSALGGSSGVRLGENLFSGKGAL
jgi:hypothetical protein